MHKIGCLLVAAMLSLVPIEACAANASSGTMRVTVLDASGKPLPLAVVEIYGPRGLRGFTGKNGATVFDAITSGTYEVEVFKNGYKEDTVRGTIVTAGGVAALTVRLHSQPVSRAAWLHTIADVKTKAKPKASTTQTGIDSPEGKLTNSALGALKSLPGVSIEGQGFAQYLSIGGHGPNQTGITVEGVPVSAFGAAPNVAMFDTDLFDSVRISQDSAYGSPGGAIDFTTRNPTLDWLTEIGDVNGSFGNAGLTLTEEGTSGRLGLSVTHASRNQGNPLDGMRFFDSSGLDYVHDALAHTDGDAFKVRYPFSMYNVLFTSAVSIRSTAPMFCTLFTGAVPCGYGPLNTQDETLFSTQVRDSFAYGRLNGSLSLFHNRSTLDVDQSGRYVNGINLPQRSNAATSANGFILDGTMQVGRDYPLNVKLTSYTQNTASAGNAFGIVTPPLLSGLAFTDASLSGTVFSKRRLSGQLALGEQRQGPQSHANGDFTLSYAAGDTDQLALQYGAGFLASPTGTFSGISDPASLQFNCAARSATGAGPSIPSGDSSSMRASLQWYHAGRHISTSLSAHHEIDFNAPVFALVGAGAFDPSLFTPAYLAAVQENNAANCGAGVQPLPLSSLYYQVGAAVGRVELDGGEINVHVESGQTVADLSYGTELARAVGLGSLLRSRASTVVAGSQLPNRPVHDANFSVAAAFDGAGATALASLHYVSANNPNNLPAYMTLDAGVRFPLQRGGQLTISVLNLTNTHAGTFATAVGAVPLSTSSGSFPTIAIPLQPHSLNVALKIPIGPDVTDTDLNVPCGDACIGWIALPFPKAQPRSVFSIDRKSGLCGPELAGPARHYLSIVQQYVARIEAERARLGFYPATFPALSSDDMELTYRQNGHSYAVLVGVSTTRYSGRVAVGKPLLACIRTSGETLEHTRARGLYISPHDERRALAPLVTFAPEVGFYIAPSLIESDYAQRAYAPVPATPPVDPFAMSNSKACPQWVRPAAEAAIPPLRDYITAFFQRHDEHPPVPPGFGIAPHVSRGGTWLEITPLDPAFESATNCLTVVGVTQEAAQKLGFDVSVPESFDYTPRLGFYMETWQ